MSHSGNQSIVPGISLDAAGQATVDPVLADLLFDLAIQLEEPTNQPVDVEHVLAAIILAARQGELDANRPLTADAELVAVLVKHVKTIFSVYDGKVGRDD
ncbi:hypothetical protein Mal52_09170 [Symmachiella dynata]|uniref:Uncharacterized protein n=1 Tax=Symmachiella dynata TaxID=2527995 RepID=A0A517ZJ15_9PLAN|nr:hypothetical protein [Symmachiella dynata]QDU42456.1 hypothetical protein Mal52_09170 [Symmachiella dynata]